MVKIINVEEAVDLIQPDSSVLITGFLGVGQPIKIMDALAESKTTGLTIASAVSAYPGQVHGIGRLVANKQVKKFIGAHIGTSKDLSRQYLDDEVEVDFIPMGTFSECVYAKGAGLGAVVTPVGLGTRQEEDHEKIVVNEKDYLLYEPIGADVALLKCAKADKMGNLQTKGTSRSLNLAMALAGKTVIAEVNEIVEVGEIEPDQVEVPGPIVDYVVQGFSDEENKEYYVDLWSKTNVLREES